MTSNTSHEQSPQGDSELTQLAASYVLHELDGQARAAVERRAATDGQLRECIASLQAATKAMGLLAPLDATLTLAPAARARLAALMPAAPTGEVSGQSTQSLAERIIGSARELIGLLVADSSRAEAQLGYRSGMQASIRTLRYDCEQGELLLRVEPQSEEDVVLLLGQADSELRAGMVHVLDEQGAECARAEVAHDGYFECIVPRRLCALRLVRHDGGTIMIPQLPLGQGPSESTEASNPGGEDGVS
jgi:hypothetical protein